jgi:hypothetical protein
MVAPRTRVACTGERMLEPSELDGGQPSRTYGGDTLDTAVRLAARVDRADPAAAARADHELAGAAVRCPGAIVLPAAMPAAADGRQAEPEQVELTEEPPRTWRRMGNVVMEQKP